MQLNSFNVVNLYLAHDFKINATMVSQLSSYLFIADILFLFPAGILLDRFSVRKIIIIISLSKTGGTNMTTLKDLHEYYKAQRADWNMFGATTEFMNRFHELFVEIGKALATEQGFENPEDANGKIPYDTVLGEKSSEAFTALESFVHETEAATAP